MQRGFLLTALATCLPMQAAAHSAIPGVAGFYWGLLHAFSVPGAILTLFALGLLIQQRLPEGQIAFWAFVIAIPVGAALSAIAGQQWPASTFLIGLAVLIGLHVALDVQLNAKVLAAIAAIAGLTCGYVSWPDPGPWNAMLLSGLGALLGSVIILTMVAGGIAALRIETGWNWLTIAVRVVGSWTCAIAILLGAAAIRG
ncbi:HupE/UreJ family protein [Paracoccus aestuariivivens]|uniref:Hydantoin utilization protein A n=1 Tax=Paracoccus aestuariivivens TaxID=1820333 RepID=A0A6L6JKE4_9RHOB|nr:HupE/UreJ family protein [Paracoccus aestuariivivens]MTH80351.1 hypothetical protein [Paracoccus aestuariivivens]